MQGWSGDHLTWDQASFNLSSFAGIPIQIEVRYATDGSRLGTQGSAQGLWFDQVEITDASSISCDTMTNVCAALPAEVSPAGSPVPFTIGKAGAQLDLRFSESAGATSYRVYSGSLGSFQSGTYDHAAAAAACRLTDASPGDGGR